MGIKETALGLHLKYPKTYVSFSRGFTSGHQGVDLAWRSDMGGAYVPVFSPADGKVVTAVDGRNNTWGTSDHGYGNYVMVEHASGVVSLVGHLLKGSVAVKVGQKVVRGQTLGTQNNSGYSNGNHVHMELRLNGTRVNPADYFFAYPDQTINANTQKEFNIKHYTPVKYWGDPVERNSAVDQLLVITDTLRARENPSLSGLVLGYVRTGYYNVSEYRDADGYRWYHCGNFWCANNAQETWCNYIPKTEPHFDLTMKKLTVKQRDAMTAWCQAEKVEFEVKEV